MGGGLRTPSPQVPQFADCSLQISLGTSALSRMAAPTVGSSPMAVHNCPELATLDQLPHPPQHRRKVHGVTDYQDSWARRSSSGRHLLALHGGYEQIGSRFEQGSSLKQLATVHSPHPWSSPSVSHRARAPRPPGRPPSSRSARQEGCRSPPHPAGQVRAAHREKTGRPARAARARGRARRWWPGRTLWRASPATTRRGRR